MRVIITAVGPDNRGLADPIVDREVALHYHKVIALPGRGRPA